VLRIGEADLVAFVGAFLWPLARVAGLVAVAPVFGNAGIPRSTKAAIAIAFTVALAPLVPPPPGLDPYSGAGLAILAAQMLIGTAMGLAMRFVFTAVDVAGELAGLQMGLGFATFFDPQNATQTPVVAQMMGLLATLTFLAINGHLMMLQALADSFASVPVAAGLAAGRGAWLELARMGSAIFVTGLMLALPVVVALLMTNVALGILTRAAPQLNIFAVGFPLTILVGWAVLGLALPHAAPLLVQAFGEGLKAMLLPLTP